MLDKMVLNFKEWLNESAKYYTGIQKKYLKKGISKIHPALQQLFFLKEDEIIPIGSAHKIVNEDEYINNINFAISKQKLIENNNISKDELYEFIDKQLNRLNYAHEIYKDKNRVNIYYPLDETKSDESEIQVHLKLTDNLPWLNFSRHCPDLEQESKYTSKYREAFLEAITECVKLDITKYFNEDYLVKEFEEFELDTEEGLYVVQKTFEGKHGILKKAIQLEDSKKFLTAEPDKFVKHVFGDGIKLDELMTFEGIMKVVKSKKFPYPKKRNQIFEHLKQRLVNYGLKIPEEIK